MDAAEAALAAEPKAKDPLDALPKGYVLIAVLCFKDGSFY